MATEPRSTNLNNFHISVSDLIKALVAAGPCVMTIAGAIWYFSAWSEKVDLRLDDIDRDLKVIHLRLQDERAPASLESYQISR